MAGKESSASVGASVCGRGAVSPTQPEAGPRGRKGALVVSPGDDAHGGDGADRRDGREAAQHLALHVSRHEVAAVRARSRPRAPCPRAASGRPPRRCGHRRRTPPCARRASGSRGLPSPAAERRARRARGVRRSRRRLASSSARVDAASFSSVTTSAERRASISRETLVVRVLVGLEGAGEIVERLAASRSADFCSGLGGEASWGPLGLDGEQTRRGAADGGGRIRLVPRAGLARPSPLPAVRGEGLARER